MGPSNTESQAANKKQHERERKQREERASAAAQRATVTNPTVPAPTSESGRSGAKRVVVTVTYDESGRVTQASGGDATALRIARQKRFPAGKGGSATVTIPIN